MVDLKKEKDPMRQPNSASERVQIPDEQASVEAKSLQEQNLEVTSWVEKIEKKFARVPNQTSDVTDDSVVVQQQAQTQQPPVTLPVNQQQMQAGRKGKTDLGVTWLVAWVVRQIKLLTRMGKKVRFQDLPVVSPEKKTEIK